MADTDSLQQQINQGRIVDVNGRPIGQAPMSFADETLLLAQKYAPDACFDRVVGTDFTPTWEGCLGGTSIPVLDPQFSGGVMSFGAGGTSFVALNPTVPSGATSRVVAVVATDNVVAASHTWTFTNGLFTAADVGATLTVSGATNGNNNATVTIASVTNSTTIVTGGTQTNETFGTPGNLTVTVRGVASYAQIVGGGAAAGSRFSSRARPWFARSRIFFAGSSPGPVAGAVGVTSGKEVVLVSVDAGYAGADSGRTAATSHAQLVIIGATSPTQAQVRLTGGFYTAGPVLTNAGPEGNLGCYGSQLPLNQFVDVSIWFDMITIRWMFSDVYVASNFLDGLTHNLDAMPYDANGCSVNNSATNDTAMGANFKVDALAFAYASESGNTIPP